MIKCFEQQRVSAARIMVVGCGALGNEVLKNLVLLGVEHLVVVDFDIVEMGNLSRSILFLPSDAEQKRLKVEVVAERLKTINPAVEVKTICGDVAYDVGLGLICQQDVVIGCVDNRWARYCINRLCMRAGIPWVDGGIEELEGTARVFMPGENCYACSLGPEGVKDLARRMPCSGIIRRHEVAGSAPTTSVVASVIGAVQVQEAMKLLHKEALENGELTSLCGGVDGGLVDAALHLLEVLVREHLARRVLIVSCHLHRLLGVGNAHARTQQRVREGVSAVKGT